MISLTGSDSYSDIPYTFQIMCYPFAWKRSFSAFSHRLGRSKPRTAIDPEYLYILFPQAGNPIKQDKP